MEEYPTEFTFVLCFLFILETVVGASLNLYVIYKRFTTKCERRSTDGRNFTTTLKSMDLIISCTAIPITFIALMLNKEPNRTVCLAKESFVMFASSGSSVCVLLISVDRYCAIVVPTKRVFTTNRIMKCKIIVFIFACVGFVLPSMTFTTEVYRTHRNNITANSSTAVPCRYILWVLFPYYFYELFYVVSFVSTLVVVCISYHSVLKVVRRRIQVRINAASTSCETGNDRLRQQETKATRVTYSVVITFLICWGPHAIITLVQIAMPFSIVVDLLQVLCLFVAFLTTLIHPLIYSQSDSTNSDQLLWFSLPRMLSMNRIIPGIIRKDNTADREQQTTSMSFVPSSAVMNVTSSSTKSSASNEHTV